MFDDADCWSVVAFQPGWRLCRISINSRIQGLMARMSIPAGQHARPARPDPTRTSEKPSQVPRPFSCATPLITQAILLVHPRALSAAHTQQRAHRYRRPTPDRHYDDYPDDAEKSAAGPGVQQQTAPANRTSLSLMVDPWEPTLAY